MRLLRNLLLLSLANAQIDLGQIFDKKAGFAGLRINTQSHGRSHSDRIRQLLSLTVPERRELKGQRHMFKDKDKCEDRCLVHPTNRFSCGKSRSRETCSDKNCCWDPNAEMCYKQVWAHCPQDRCESIHPDDRAQCSALGGSGSWGMEKCENAGCCYDSYNRQCYDSNPSSAQPVPDTAECREVKAVDRRSCGFGLARDACTAMSGCCWRVDKDSTHFCYKSALFASANNKTVDEQSAADTVFIKVDQVEPPFPVVNLKMASKKEGVLLEDETAQVLPGDKAKKFQLWMSYISALTNRIEVACQRKTKPIDCIKRAANVLLVAKEEMLRSDYGLQFAETAAEANEMLEGINDVLIWFCLNQPSARFCRTLVLSGFTLSQIDNLKSDIIGEANSRFSAMLKLGEYGMLGEYQHRARNEVLHQHPSFPKFGAFTNL